MLACTEITLLARAFAMRDDARRFATP